MCNVSCGQKAEPEQQQQRETKSCKLSYNGDMLAVVGSDTLEIWTGADGENRIAGLANRKKAGLSINFGAQPGRISIWSISVYRNGERVGRVAVDNGRPVYEESGDSMTRYDKFGFVYDKINKPKQWIYE